MATLGYVARVVLVVVLAVLLKSSLSLEKEQLTHFIHFRPTVGLELHQLPHKW